MTHTISLTYKLLLGQRPNYTRSKLKSTVDANISLTQDPIDLYYAYIYTSCVFNKCQDTSFNILQIKQLRWIVFMVLFIYDICHIDNFAECDIILRITKTGFVCYAHYWYILQVLKTCNL